MSSKADSTTFKGWHPVRFLLNRPTHALSSSSEPVKAPAFSLTKVMAVIATLIGPVVAALTKALSGDRFSTGELAAMFVALVGFLAVVTAADVIARAVSLRATAASGGTNADPTVVRFTAALPAVLHRQPPKQARVIAFSPNGNGRFLVFHGDDQLTWMAPDEFTFAELRRYEDLA